MPKFYYHKMAVGAFTSCKPVAVRDEDRKYFSIKVDEVMVGLNSGGWVRSFYY